MGTVYRAGFVVLAALASFSCGSDEGPPGIGGAGIPVPVDEALTPALVCPAYTADAFPEMAPLDMANASSIGAIDGAFSVSPTGSVQYSMRLTLPPSRLAPALGVAYDSQSPSGIFGKGFALTGLSSIHRCGSNLAQDNRIRGVQLNAGDHFCINGARLVQINEGKDSIGTFAEYRTAIDSHTKILGYGASSAAGFDPTYFVAYLSNGNIVHYGKSSNARVRWRGGVTRAWSKELEVDRRGNTIRYAYFADHGDTNHVTTREQVIQEIRYTGFIEANGTETLGNASVEFHYDDDDRYGKLFYEGEEVSRRMRLVRIDMRTNGVIVWSNRFTYDQDAATNEALLVKIDECAKGDLSQCKPATTFDWRKANTRGFASHVTSINVPTKSEDEQFSYTVADVTGDGAVEIVTSTTDPDSGMNRWFVYENDGHGSFGVPVEWASIAYPKGFTKTWRITPLDENGDGRVDLLIDQPDGAAWNTFRVLRAVENPSPHFDLVATGIPRTSQHRASEFTVDSHSGLAVADLDADGMNDVITCHDLRTWYGKSEYVPDNCNPFEDCKPSLARWSAHLWRPNGGPGGAPGFEKTERHIEALDGVSCWTMNRFFGAVDWNVDGQTELVTVGKDGHFWTHQLDVPTLHWESQSLSAMVPNVLGLDIADDPVANMITFPLTHVHAEQMEGEWHALRVLFPDLNGDGYPDVLFVGPRGTNVKPFVAINEGRDEYMDFMWPYDAIDGNVNTFDYSPFARVFDYSGDQRDDLVIPVVGACTTTDAYACYVVFESGRVGEQAKVSFTDVPFEHPDEYDVAPQYLIRTADVNGDALTDIVHPMVSDQLFVFANQSAHNMLTSVTTGRNPLDPGDPDFLPDVTFEYGNLVDGAAHAFPWQYDSLTYIAHADAANTCVYPRTCVMGGLPVVSAYTLNNGQNKARRFSMHYRDGRAHRHGRGFLGFAEVETRDVDTGIAMRQRFDNVTFDPTFNAFPFAGIPSETRTTTPLSTTTLETRASTEYEVVPTNGGKTYFLSPLSTENLRKEGADILERSWTIVDDVDEFGNVLQWRSGSDGVDVLNTSTRIAKNDPATWLIGLVEQESTCSTALGETRCRTSTMKHNALGEVFRIDRAPNDTTAHLVTYLIRDQYGNVINTIAEDDVGNHREECVTFEPTGTFPWAVRNAAGHTSYMHYHHGLGVPFSMRDANGLVTKWRYDNFGRTVEEHAPDGLVTTFSAERVKSGVWTTHVKASTPGHGARETVFDSFERPMQMRVRGPDVDTVGISAFGKSVWIVQDKRYDFLGRLQWQSIPRIDGDVIAAMKGSTFEYDNAGRLTKTVTPWGAPIAHIYNHDKVATVEPGPAGISTIARSVEHDPLGRPIEVTDANQGITRHIHGPFNELRRVELPDGTARETKEDDYGRVIFLDDPDRGKTILEHNGFDELIKLHDAAGRHYAFERDALGRAVKRSEGLNVSTYEYDTAPHGVGLLARTTGADGHSEEYAYDTLSRPIATTLQLADGRTFEQSRTYDAFGRIAQIAYPNGFSVLRQYDSTGTLVRIHNGADRTHVVWSLDVVNAAGQTMYETFGNGAATERVYSDEAGVLETIFTMADGKTLQSLRYEYDAQLNVKNRLDARQGKIERFRHDALNRVTCSRVDACPNAGMCFDADLPCDVDVHYGPTGNVTYKSDVGTYAADPLHPHAVKSAGALQFAHDAVGNQIERPTETITYTDFDLPRQYIPKAGGAPTTFEYNAVGERVRRIRGETETVYLGDVYERETHGNVITDRFYVHNDERVIAVVERLQSGDAWRYVHADHLGSVDVITDAGGQEIDRRSFDVWGAPRDPKWAGNGAASQNVSTRRGFTWHEWDDDVGLINAKGRIYDPHIARFLQTDPIIADLLDAQTQNPYAYVFNRPLVMTDPSGYDAEAHSILLQGAGSPGYVTPEQAQLVQDHQKTWLMQWPRESPATAPPHQSVVEWGPAGADPAPSSPEKVGPGNLSAGEQVLYGVGERAIELGPELAVGLLFNFVGAGASGGATAKPGSGSFDGAGVRVIDDLNQANPLYGASIGVIQLGEAHEKGDYVGIGRAGLDVVTVVVMTAITLKASRGVVDQAKFRYLFGEAGGNTHNVARTAQNAGQMARIGVYNTAEGQALLKSHFESAVKDSSNIVRTFKNQYGAFQVRESLFAGPGGFVKFESTWQVLEGGGLRFTTAIPFGGP